MGWLAARGGHVVEGREMPRRVRSLHGLLHLLSHLMHDGVGHGGHEILVHIHCNVGLSLEWALPDRAGICPGAL